jgi:hypothetical protein
MIAGTFGLSGLLLLITAHLFAAGLLSQVSQTAAWFVFFFFFASAAASSAYLTASETFPLETRALAIACFYAVGTAIGGSVASLWLADRIWIRPSCYRHKIVRMRCIAGLILTAGLTCIIPERLLLA